MKRFPPLICLVLLLLLVVAGVSAVEVPVITGVSPSSGPNSGTIHDVRISGTGFAPGSWAELKTCAINPTAIRGSCDYSGPTLIICSFPLHGAPAGKRHVLVYNDDQHYDLLSKAFEVYEGTSTTGTTTTTTTTKTTRTTTATPVQSGDNSVFFETEPPGATVFLNGNEIGTSTFTYYTYNDGVFDVLVKKIGYADYSDRVTIVEGERVRFYALLTPLGSSGTTSTTNSAATSVTTTASAKPGKTTTTIMKSTIQLPTPWGTDPPAEESPADPAIVFVAAALGIVLVVIHRR